MNEYLDLNKEIISSEKKEQNQLIETKRCSTSAFWIKNLHKKNYLFKVTEKNQEFRSLIIEEMANLTNIKVPHTQLATFNGYFGELIEDYRRPEYQYVSGSTILYEYFLFARNTDTIKSIIPKYLNKDNLTNDEKNIILKQLNNLETIWNALEFRYQKYSNREAIIFTIMQKLAHRFSFDFITMQCDRHASNWEIEENNITADLTPLYDSNRSFYYPSFNLEFHIQEKFKSSEIYEELEYYLTYSDSIFSQYFYQLFAFFTPEKIENMIEKKTIIPKQVQIEMISSYKEHYSNIEKLMERRRKKQ